MSNIILVSLIQEHKERLPYLRNYSDDIFTYYEYDDMNAYHLWVETVKRYMQQYCKGDPAIKEFKTLSDQSIAPDQQRKLLAIIEAIAVISGSDIDKESDPSQKSINEGVNITINNSNNQSQNQEQSFAVQLFLEAIKDDLTGRQIKELKNVVDEAGSDLQKARKGIFEKLKGFGADVASNIVANILTNPTIWNGL